MRRRKRRHPALPPLLRVHDGPEGMEVLEEIEGGLGELLWEALRRVLVWARTPIERRVARAAGEEAPALAIGERTQQVPPGIATAVEVLARVGTQMSSPGQDALRTACLRVSEWASQHGHFGTAAMYAQAAVAIRAEDAEAAYLAGRAARKRGEVAQAETWFRYAISTSRATGDWTSYTKAYVGLGNLYSQRGNFPLARRALTRALRSARRHRLRALEAMVLHDMFTIAAETRQTRAAERFATAAAEAYGSGHPRLPVLAKDLAFFWTERGRYAQAVALQRQLVLRIEGVTERLLLFSAISRAAAGARMMDLYASARAETLRLIADTKVGEAVAAAWLNLAYAAEQAEDLGRSLSAAEQAVEAADQTRESKVQLNAESLIERVTQRLTDPGYAAAEAPAVEPTPSSSEGTDLAASTFRALLAAGPG